MVAEGRGAMNMRHQGIGMTSRRTRERMVKRLMEQGVWNAAVLDAIRNTPRHIFVEEALASRAYEDTALPIGYSQTISQPYIVARMTELILQNRRPKKVLEVGTGSGYQTAVLARLVPKVYSVERILPLQRHARQRLLELRVRNVTYKHSDGGWGWEEHAPYDAILVTAAPPEVPHKLLEQMAVGGIMVIPVGRGTEQALQRVIRTDDGCEMDVVGRVSFVPFLSGSH